MIALLFFLCSGLFGIGALYLGMAIFTRSQGLPAPTGHWALMLGATFFVLVSGWFIIWSGGGLIFVMLLPPVAFFAPLALVAWLLGKVLAARWQPGSVLQMVFVSVGLVALGSAPIWARFFEMRNGWMADIPLYAGAERVVVKMKMVSDIHGGPEIQATYRLPMATEAALAFYAATLESQGWERKANAMNACWSEGNQSGPCSHSYRKGSRSMDFGPASQQDGQVTAPAGPVKIKLFVSD